MTNNSSTHQLIIFDFDGTLGDTRRNIVMTMQQTIQVHQMPYRDADACASTIGLPLNGCFKQLFPDITEEQLSVCAATYRRLFEENRVKFPPELFPDVMTTLQQLHSQGYVMAIASSRSSRSLHQLVDDLNLRSYISCIVGADDVSRPKPDAEPVIKILEALHFSPEETIVVGDMPVDILMGRNAGTYTCGVTYGNATRQELQQANAHHIIDNFPLLIDILS